MPFPDSERVIYQRNPLLEVICQLRFPSILRIDSEAPAVFQERVRKEYPMYQEALRHELFIGVQDGVTGDAQFARQRPRRQKAVAGRQASAEDGRAQAGVHRALARPAADIVVALEIGEQEAIVHIWSYQLGICWPFPGTSALIIVC